MIIDVCLQLKEKRKALGYSIEYVVEKTKLYPSVIRDIENGDLTKISPTYLKGFLKIYAVFLGVELGDSLQKLGAAKTADVTAGTKKPSHDSNRERVLHFSKNIPPHIKKIVVSVIAGICVLWFLVAIGKAVVGKISRMAAPRPHKIAAQAPAARRSRISVSIAAKNNVYIKAIVDGSVLFDGILRKGIIEKWEGTKEIEFKINDGSAVVIDVNGKNIPALSAAHKPIKSLKVKPTSIVVEK